MNLDSSSIPHDRRDELAERGKKPAAVDEQYRLYLINKKTAQLIHGVEWEPRTFTEATLHRIGAEPTPLFSIQGDPTNRRSFQSDPQARICQLRHQFGFQIENRIDRSVSPALSFYWLLVDEHGRPKMKDVPLRSKKKGRPAAQKDSATVSKTVPAKSSTSHTSTTTPAERKETTAAHQPGLFAELRPVPPQRAKSSFLDFEKGNCR